MPTVFRRILGRLAATIFRRTQIDREVDEELRYHLERERERLIAQGMTPEDARWAARRAFGNPTVYGESARDATRWTALEQLGQDVRYAARALRATPVFTIVAALSLALGLGANIALFSAGESVLFRRLAVPHPEQLVSTRCSCPYSMYRDFKALGSASPFRDVAAVAILDRTNVSIGGHDGVVRRVALVTGNYFSLFGVSAALGRTIGTRDDDVLDGNPVAVISDRRWHDLGGRADVLGSRLTINSTIYTIIGVAAPGFTGDAVGRPIDVWVPMTMQSDVMPELPDLLRRDNGFLRIVMRLAPGVRVTQAQAAIQPAYQRHEIRVAGANATAEFRRNLIADPLQLLSIERGFVPDRDIAAQWLSILAMVVAIVLIIACTNVATLFLVRGATRAREMAVRSALGAGRRRLIQQVLTEATMLSLLGGLLGMLLALWTTSLLSRTASFGPVQMDSRVPSSIHSFDFHPASRTYVVAALVSIIVGVLFGLLPALRAAGELGREGLIAGRPPLGRRVRSGRPGGALVIAQVALSIVLLVGTGLFVRTLGKLRQQDLALDRRHLLLVWTVPAMTAHRPAELPAYLDRLIQRISEVPGVVAVSATNHGLLEGGDVGGESGLLKVDGQPAREGAQVMRAAVGPNFFTTAGMTILAGRDFRPSDDTLTEPVGVMSESLARHLFGDRSPVGHSLGAAGSRIQIVGVVRDTKHGSPRDPRGVWYVYYRQMPGLMRGMCVIIRTEGDPATLRRVVMQTVRAFDATLPVLRVDTIEEQLNDVLFQERAIAALSVVFAALAVALACIGLYGMMSYAVARRTGEIGVRMALGSTAGGVLRLVVGDSIRVVTAGSVIGLPLALLLARVVRVRLYGVSPVDPITIAGAALLMLVMSLLASIIPSWRAASIDPSTALRAE